MQTNVTQHGTLYYDGWKWAKQHAKFDQLKLIAETDLDAVASDNPHDEPYIKLLSRVRNGDDSLASQEATIGLLASFYGSVDDHKVRDYLSGAQAACNESKHLFNVDE